MNKTTRGIPDFELLAVVSNLTLPRVQGKSERVGAKSPFQVLHRVSCAASMERRHAITYK
jgi:hypothetical protein